ncbi:MFS transporter [Brevibacillus laterosporus]|uniref:MFS transporter n=1 Tax=Brevibacillus laterosporus TaxID=1465 RepID=UPI000CE3368C|nr:MFS transporter [Brevibacillus laterosporus]MED1666862.1 MFS transporter [Brevibacillus laterosporus]MED1671828.1 MFS transporter [Brevibacillus laterosporus]MED1718469.1 MFS transporter [Brevibacillus laterosporus]PPA82442.1 MFS transporter [Brevibacillus laterosporus]
MKDKKTWDLISVASIPLVMTLGNSMLIPVLTIMEKKLGISPLQASMLITTYSVVAILLIPLAGFLSDRIGRKTIIIPSLLIAGLGGLLSGWAAWKMANPYMMILVGRTLQGVGAAGAFPIVMPLIGDMYQNKKEVSSGLGIIETSNTFGKVLSPVLGAWLATLIWYLPFLATPIFCLVSLLLVAFFVKAPQEKQTPKSFQEYKKSILAIFQAEGRWLYAVFAIGCISMLVLFGVLFHLSSVLEDQYKWEGIKKGLVLAIPLASLCLVSYVTGRLIGENKQLMKWLSFSGMLILFGSMLWISFSQRQSIYLFLILLCVSGAGIGATLPSLDALLTKRFDKAERGTITAFYNSARFVGVASGPPLFAYLITVSHRFLFLTVAGICLVAAILSLFAIKPAEKATKKEDGGPESINMLRKSRVKG